MKKFLFVLAGLLVSLCVGILALSVFMFFVGAIVKPETLVWIQTSRADWQQYKALKTEFFDQECWAQKLEARLGDLGAQGLTRDEFDRYVNEFFARFPHAEKEASQHLQEILRKGLPAVIREHHPASRTLEAIALDRALLLERLNTEVKPEEISWVCNGI